MTGTLNPPQAGHPAGYRYRRRASLTAQAYWRVAVAVHRLAEGLIAIRTVDGRMPHKPDWESREEIDLIFHARTQRAATFLKFLVGGDDISRTRTGKPVIRAKGTVAARLAASSGTKRPDRKGPIVY